MDDSVIGREISEGLDRTKAEDALIDFMTDKIGGAVEIFESNTVGVIAFERLSYIDEDKIDYDELSDALRDATGVPVACIANCDWTFDDRSDEEATLIAFRIPSLDEGYKDDPRNMLSPAQERYP